MAALTHDQAHAHARSLKDQVVLITGAASGIGRRVAIDMAKYGAKLVLGDMNVEALKTVEEEVRQAGGTSISGKCDVLSWDEQFALFTLGFKTFGSIDVVLPNAGVTELHPFECVVNKDGSLSPPDLRTFNIDITAVLYTTTLALAFFDKNSKSRKSLRAIVLTASMSTFFGAAPEAIQYSVAKAGVMGVMNGLYQGRAPTDNIRVSMVAPYYTQTPLLPKDFNPGPPGFSTIEDVSDAFLSAATDPKANGNSYTVPDKHGIWVLDQKALRPKGFTALGQARRAMKAKL